MTALPGSCEQEYDGPPPLPAGALIAPAYEVVEHLRRGEALDVYDVWSEERDCRCVVKTPRPDRMEDVRVRERLLREGQLLQSFTHPHLIRAYETLEVPRPVVVLETLAGATLGHLIDNRSRRLGAADLAFLGLHLCSAVQYLHRHGLLHLDVKPSNVVAHCGLAKLLDLSLARPPGRGARGVGTSGYLSPEQASSGELTSAVDVWGIGATLFEAAAGRRPFEPEDDEEGRYPQLERRAPSVRRHRRLPGALARTIDDCLEPRPSARPTVGAVAAALDHTIPPAADAVSP